MKSLSLTIVLVLTGIQLFSQETVKHEIDKFVEECVEKAEGYKEKAVCYKLSLKKWDKEIETYYNRLSSELYLDTKELIDRSHETWIQYKKFEYAAIDDMLSQLKGDFYSMLQAKLQMRLVRNRATELKMLYEVLHQP